jgi:hypothetical protein
MSLRAFFAKQSHHWEIATPQGERMRLAMTGTWVLMSDFLSEGQPFPVDNACEILYYLAGLTDRPVCPFAT